MTDLHAAPQAVADPDAPANERRIRIGGLMRCCIQTIHECSAKVGVGSVLPCKWCSDSMRVGVDGIWEWNHV